jgi:ComF family protein
MPVLASLYNATQNLLRLLYPPKCVYCCNLLSKDRFEAGICADCEAHLPRVSPVDLRWVEGALCLSPFWYRDGIRDSIRRYKFSGRSCYRRIYGRELRSYLLQAGLEAPDYVTWAPLSRKRLHQRGYDQGKLLAQEAAWLYGKQPLSLLAKVRNTKAQSSLSAAQRQENVLGAYAYTGSCSLAGKRVLLVDDVVTTGATLGACVQLLYQAGAEEVVCLTLARSSREG